MKGELQLKTTLFFACVYFNWLSLIIGKNYIVSIHVMYKYSMYKRATQHSHLSLWISFILSINIINHILLLFHRIAREDSTLDFLMNIVHHFNYILWMTSAIHVSKFSIASYLYKGMLENKANTLKIWFKPLRIKFSI